MGVSKAALASSAMRAARAGLREITRTVSRQVVAAAGRPEPAGPLEALWSDGCSNMIIKEHAFARVVRQHVSAHRAQS
jgi:hypothetical protein